jgi:hypothetical protein
MSSGNKQFIPMKINADTRISDLIKENKESIDAIASLAKPLEKLKNPILRKVMASRVTIAEAAKMGSCKIEDFARALQPLGFEFITTFINSENGLKETPSWLKELPYQNIENFDVREILQAGKDPLKQIIQKFKQIRPKNALCIINTFVPTPLIHLLEKDGAQTYTEQINEKEFHTYFLKPFKEKAASLTSEKKVFMDDQIHFDLLCAKFDGKIKEIDVRHLDMPLPMQTILSELAQLSNEYALYVHHKRIPIYLLEELADQDFQVHVRHIEENNVKLLIFKV